MQIPIGNQEFPADKDALDLAAAGYTSHMPRHFSLFSMMALSFALTCTWSGTGSSIGIALTEASGAGAIWSLFVGAAGTAILTAGLAELASAFPVAGAQYYYSYMVSSPKYRAFAAYMNGWMSILGWWLAFASVINFGSSMIMSLAIMWHPNYELQRYQQWLLFVALTWLGTAINVFLHHLIPAINKGILILACVSLTATFITLLVCSRHHLPSGKYIFGDNTNSTGWSSDGFAYILAVSNAVYAYLGTDCAAHLAEELPKPGRNIPLVMMWPILMGLVTAFPFAVSLVASITDLDAVLNTPTGLPLLEIYYQGTGSKSGATVLLVLFILCFYGCALANVTTSSRTLWAVSRDGALPFSHIFERVHPRYKVPVNAMILSASVVSAYAALFIASSVAFSSMVSAAILFLQTSIAIPQGILLWRGRDILPPRHFDLGMYGKWFNIGALIWVGVLDVIYCMPVFYPVTTVNMNYVSVVTVGLLALVLLNWFIFKRKTFKGPKIDLEEVKRRREDGLVNLGTEAGVGVADHTVVDGDKEKE